MKRKDKASQRSKTLLDHLDQTANAQAADATTVEDPPSSEYDFAAADPESGVPLDYDAIHGEEFLDADVESLRDLVRGPGAIGSQLESHFEQLGDSGFFSIASLPWEDRLTKSIRQTSGWSVADLPIKSDALLTPVFSDGVKNYRFDSWKIYVTYRRLPGLTVLDWSPESLEEDIRRAREVPVPEKYDVRQTAKCLIDQFTKEQLEEIWNLILNDNTSDHPPR